MNNFLKIGKRKIGLNFRPLVIAEIGINHNGSLKIAKKMVDLAKLNGAECIKHQTHVIDDEMSIKAKKVHPANQKKSIYQIMKECALSEKDEISLKKYVEQKKMIFLSTPFSRAAADRLKKMNVQAYKIGSGECNNLPLINHIAKFNKPMIISTGMNNIKSIKETVNVLKKYNTKFALLHCTNIYPTPFKMVRLGAMLEIKKNFPNIVYGLSDHTTSNLACLGAVALGASIIERHFTDTMKRKGPDIINSMDPFALKNLITDSNNLFLMRGGKKEAIKLEKKTIDFAFATVVSLKEIKKGEKLTKDNIWVKRPAIGEIFAKDYEKILGKKTTKLIKKDHHLKYSDLN
jgi:sialic acid synthase SpsE